MMIRTIRLTRRRAVLAVLLFGALTAALIFLLGGKTSRETPIFEAVLPDNAARAAYLQKLGWEVDEEPTATLQVRIPDPLTEEYADYNALQRRQGLDLEPWRGKDVTRYTYAVRNYPGLPADVLLDLYLCGDRLVAGDVVCVGEDAFMDTLRFPAEK